MTSQKTNQHLDKFIDSICSTTFVNQKKSEAWTDIPLTKEYKVTFELINDTILSAFPKGKISYEG
ncbi:MAG: hypothetical protein KKE44_10725, partial [Proteobacteria bacterium]|nr:hypothetical protein [Pseudomonadota bacterium]MBU1583197.1 hypothetical protein [Pseudomonadota bacterium]